MHEISFPTLARLYEHHRSRHGEAVALIARSLSLLVGAAVGILAGFASPIVRIVFDERWVPAVGAVRAALFGGIAVALTSLLSAAVQSIGRPGVRFRSYLVAAAVGLVLLVPMVRGWGATGGAVAVYLIVPVVDLAILIVVTRARLQRAVLNLGVITAAALGLSLALARLVDSFPALVGAGIVSGLAACVLILLTDRAALFRSLSFLRNRTPASDASPAT